MRAIANGILPAIWLNSLPETEHLYSANDLLYLAVMRS